MNIVKICPLVVEKLKLLSQGVLKLSKDLRSGNLKLYHLIEQIGFFLSSLLKIYKASKNNWLKIFGNTMNESEGKSDSFLAWFLDTLKRYNLLWSEQN